MKRSVGHFSKSKNAQKGAALVIALLILLVMTLIGVTTMQTTTMEEKMVGNVHDRNRAFQAAEVALRDAEEVYIQSLINTSDFGSTSGLYTLAQSEPDPFSVTWDDTNSQLSSFGNLQGDVQTAPRYRIKIAHVIEGDKKTLNIKGYGKKAPAPNTTIFNVIGRGTGGTNQSQVILRTRYGHQVN